MPRLTGDQMVSHAPPVGNFKYSAVGIDKLGASEYTLATIVIDVSGSVGGFVAEMTAALKEIINACKYSKRADNLMVRVVIFDDKIEEVHGFKLLPACNLADYDNVLRVGGTTALYDAAATGIKATTDFGKQLTDKEFSVNGIVFVITDGCNNSSVRGVGAVKDALVEATKSEMLESLVSILIAVNMQDPSVATELNNFHKDAGFTQFVELKDASAKTLARLAEFVSQSISSQSQALGTGGPSKSLTF